MTNGKRAPRLGLPREAVTVRGSVPLDEVPGRSRIGQRRWEELAGQVIEASKKGDALVIEVGQGYRLDVVRAGLGEELKRQNHRLKSQTITNGDASHTVYLIAEPMSEIEDAE